MVTNYYGNMKAGTLSLTALAADTNAGCDFIEDAFEETFSSPVLNTTRWLPDELDGQEHCLGLPPSGPQTCTMMLGSQVKLAQPFPAYTGDTTSRGAILTLSQGPCNDPANPYACCNSKRTLCASWAGSHLVSAGCIQWGVLEIEAAFNMPNNGYGFYFTATYVVYGTVDPAWNEIDIGMINNVLGQLEFHATVFTADKRSPTATLMDALNFAQSTPTAAAPSGVGTSINVNTPIKLINGVPVTPRFYNSSFASAFHTYKVVWTPNSVAWMVDTTVYRNLTYSPWRPMSIRQILRTNNGTNVGPNFADSQVFIRRLRYTPYSAQAVADAYRCTSMFACYGPMAPAPVATASTFVSLSATPSLAAGRRALLQQATLQAAALSDAVASVLPGMPPDNVTATPSAFGLSMRLSIFNLDFNSTGDALDMYTDAGLQAQLLSGVVDDVIPGPGNVLVQGVSQDGTGKVVYVDLLVSGYASYADALTDYRTFTASGAAELDSTAASLNDALGLVTTPYVATAESAPAGAGDSYAGATPASNALTADAILADPTKCPNYPSSWDTTTCVNPAGALPVGNANPANDWCDACVLLDVDNVALVTTYGVTVPIAASAKDSVEAALANSMSTGALSAAVANPTTRRRLLQSVTIGNVTVPSQCAPSQNTLSK